VPRRPNFVALALSASLVACGLVATLRWRPAIPGLGVMRSGAASNAGTPREVPAPGSPCAHERRTIHGGYRFLPRCAGQAPSFDRRYYVVKNAGIGTGVGLVRGGTGESLADLGVLDSGQPFILFWSPVDHRFFANQQGRDGVERFRLFAPRGTRIVELPALTIRAREILRARRPCLAAGDIAVSGIRWSSDARHIALLVYARRQACGGTGNWRPLWMIGDSATGRIDPGSVRVRHGRAPLPADGPYARL
jgi:hypothetical protein